MRTFLDDGSIYQPLVRPSPVPLNTLDRHACIQTGDKQTRGNQSQTPSYTDRVCIREMDDADGTADDEVADCFKDCTNTPAIVPRLILCPIDPKIN